MLNQASYCFISSLSPQPHSDYLFVTPYSLLRNQPSSSSLQLSLLPHTHINTDRMLKWPSYHFISSLSNQPLSSYHFFYSYSLLHNQPSSNSLQLSISTHTHTDRRLNMAFILLQLFLLSPISPRLTSLLTQSTVLTLTSALFLYPKEDKPGLLTVSSLFYFHKLASVHCRPPHLFAIPLKPPPASSVTLLSQPFPLPPLFLVFLNLGSLLSPLYRHGAEPGVQVHE